MQPVAFPNGVDFISTHPLSQAVFYPSNTPSNQVVKIGQANLPTGELKTHGLSGVSALFRHRGPAAIVEVVAIVIIFSLYGVFGSGAFAHSSKKFLEPAGAGPLLADADSPTSISVPRRVIGVCAAVNHPSVDSVFGGDETLLFAAGLPMSDVSRVVISVQAPATLGAAPHQITLIDFVLRPTLASANPEVSVASFDWAPTQDGESGKNFPFKVGDGVGGHWTNFIGVLREMQHEKQPPYINAAGSIS